MTNFVILSPHFPETYWKFAEGLKKNGVNVLGIGDAPYHELSPQLKNVLTEYYFCPNMVIYSDLYKAFAYFSFKYGKIDWVESNNEFWLEKDAKLRTDFNLANGIRQQDILAYKSKSEMKKYYQEAQVKVARHLKSNNPEEVKAFAMQVGYPLFAKPDIGVGANSTFRLNSAEQVDAFFLKKDNTEYIIEEFINGTIVSFDGICNSKHEPVLYLNHLFPVPNDIAVNEKADDYYYSLADIASDLEAAGRRVLKAFKVQKRFFHLEFFRLNEDKPGLGLKGDLVALEVNMRPPGGFTTEMISACLGVNCYQVWADVIIYDENRQVGSGVKAVVVEVARRDNHRYAHTPEEIMLAYSQHIIMKGRYSPIISVGMGDTFYIASFPTFEEADLFRHFVLKHQESISPI